MLSSKTCLFPDGAYLMQSLTFSSTLTQFQLQKAPPLSMNLSNVRNLDIFTPSITSAPKFGMADAQSQAKLNQDLADLINNKRARKEEIIQKLEEITKGSRLVGYELFLDLACRNGNLPAIQALVEAKVDINFVHPISSLTPIAIAADKGDIAVIKYLLSQGAQLNAGKGVSFHPIVLAANCHDKKKGFQAFQILMRSGVKINSNNLGANALCTAATGNYQIAEALLKYGVPANSVYKGQTPLTNAATCGELKIVQLLLRNGAEVDSTADYPRYVNEGRRPGIRRTALIFAAIDGNVEIIKILLNAGASKTIKDSLGKTAANLATNSSIRRLIETYVPKESR